MAASASASRATSIGGLLLRRWFGCWIDFIALAVVFGAPAVLLGLVGATNAVAAGAGLVVAVLYFPLTEGLWGRSLGKLISGTIVVDRMGKTPGIGRAAVRTVARLFEVNPFLLGGLPAGIVTAHTRAHQRIGDLLAGTYVVPLKELRQAQTQPDADIQAVAEHFS